MSLKFPKTCCSVHQHDSAAAPPVIDASGLIELLDLFLKNGENCVGGITSLEPCGERVCKEVVLCTLFICFHGVIENLLKMRG